MKYHSWGKILRTTALFLAVAAIIPGTFAAAITLTGTATVSLTVIDEKSGSPIESTWVNLYKWDDLNQYWAWLTIILTDANGEVTFENLETGDYTFDAGKSEGDQYGWGYTYYDEWYDDVFAADGGLNAATVVHLEPEDSLNLIHDLRAVPVKIKFFFRNNVVPSSGGEFVFRVTFENTTNTYSSLKNWVIVSGSTGLGLWTNFQSGPTAALTLGPYQKVVQTKRIAVPSAAYNTGYSVGVYLAPSSSSPWVPTSEGGTNFWKGTGMTVTSEPAVSPESNQLGYFLFPPSVPVIGPITE